MTKIEVQKRILHDGEMIKLNDFMWDEKTKTFSSELDNLVIDFSGINFCTFKTGASCVFNTGGSCTFDTGSYCTFDTGCSCTFDTGSYCTFDTGYSCVFNTGGSCTFDTGSYCTFNTGSNCTFNTSSDCVVVRREIFEVINLNDEKNNIKLCSYKVKGYLKLIDGKYYLNGEIENGEHIIADGILSKVINKKGNVYKVINNGETEVSFIIQDGDVYSHGKTLKEAKESLIYKISNRDTSKYKDLTLDSEISFEEAIKMYRTITGACENGCKYFVEQNKDKIKDVYTIKEIIELTKDQYNSDVLKGFFIKN